MMELEERQMEHHDMAPVAMDPRQVGDDKLCQPTEPNQKSAFSKLLQANYFVSYTLYRFEFDWLN